MRIGIMLRAPGTAGREVRVPSLYEKFGYFDYRSHGVGLSGGDLNRGRLRGSGRDGALLVDPRDINSVADGIYPGLTNAELRSELIERGLARTRHFTWNVSAPQTIELFAAMMKEAGTEAGPRTLEGRSP